MKLGLDPEADAASLAMSPAAVATTREVEPGMHTIRLQLKACGIHLSWDSIRRELDGQDRVTVELKRADGRTIHVRKATRAEPRQHSSTMRWA